MMSDSERRASLDGAIEHDPRFSGRMVRAIIRLRDELEQCGFADSYRGPYLDGFAAGLRAATEAFEARRSEEDKGR